MPDVSFQDREEYLRAVQARMMHHSFAHVLAAIDPRTAMICAKKLLFRSPLKSPLPRELLEVIENPRHALRLPCPEGPLIFYRKGEREGGFIELALLLLNPDLRVRRAGVVELERQITLHRPFLAPESAARFSDLRPLVLSDGVQESLGAAVELYDCLRNDYFYQHAALRQCATGRMVDEFRTSLQALLTPNQVTMQFLVGLPVWSAERQDADIQAMRRDLLQSAATLPDLLSTYFRLFGHLPLAGRRSIAGTVASWRERHGDPSDPWRVVWAWAKDNASPLASYHACQALCHTPVWVGDLHRPMLLSRIADVIRGPSGNVQWKRRCDLARHYCLHLEALSPGADGERVAALAWWFAEMLGATIDGFPKAILQIADEVVRIASAASEEVWTVARPFVSVSPLRYATLYSGSMWSTAMICELASSPLAPFADKQESIREALTTSLAKPAYGAVATPGDDPAIWYAFESSADALFERIASATDAKTAASLRSARSVASCDVAGLGTMVRQLASCVGSESLAIAHRVRRAAYCGDAPCADLWDGFADRDWRERVLARGAQACVEFLCSAAIQLQLSDFSHEWRSYLPHFLALTCEELAGDTERKRMLFAYTVVSSIAVDSVSAVERLLTGAHRRDYEDFVKKWRERIERLTPLAPAWISARLRAMKAVLYVD